VGKIYQLEVDKENHRGGRPSKLSPTNQRRIITQITTGKLDNAVHATNYINTIIQSPVCPQTFRNILRKGPFQGSGQGKKAFGRGQTQVEK